LRIIASSREALGIAGEVSYRVPSLRLPDLNNLPQIESLGQYEAVHLFIERACAALPDFHITNENAPVVVQICHRLDGIPLAIELAAAKIRALSVEQIAKRLDDRFRLLTGGSRTALERHRTLRAMLDWSYNLLPVSEQVLFCRLSTFVNGWTLEAAEIICAGDALLVEDIFDLLEQLVNKSLVSVEEWQAETRYRMLETMRQYAEEKLIEAGESELLRDRHLAHYLDLAESAAPHLIRPEQVEWLDRLEAAHDNLRSALEWSLGKERPEQALRMAAALGTFWYMHCHWMEGARWLEKALAMRAEAITLSEKATRARALYQDVLLANALENIEHVYASAKNSLTLCQEGTDRLDLAISKYYMGLAFFNISEFEKALPLIEQSLVEFRELQEPYWEAVCQWRISRARLLQGEQNWSEVIARNIGMARKTGERLLTARILREAFIYAWTNNRLAEANAYLEEADRLNGQVGFKFSSSILHGMIAHARKDYPRARELYREAIERLELIGEKSAKGSALEYLGLIAKDEGNVLEAQTYVEQAVTIAREVGWKATIVYRLGFLGHIHFLQGNPEDAKRCFRESLAIGKSIHHFRYVAISLIYMGSYLAESAPRRAIQILSAIHSYETKEKSVVARDPFAIGDFEEAVARARQALGESAFQEAWAEGEILSIEQACDLALKALEEV
jgi:predicted ATPase